MEMKPAQVVQAATKKDWHKKEKLQNDTWSLQSQTTTLLNAESSPKDGFESELYLGKLFAFYV